MIWTRFGCHFSCSFPAPVLQYAWMFNQWAKHSNHDADEQRMMMFYFPPQLFVCFISSLCLEILPVIMILYATFRVALKEAWMLSYYLFIFLCPLLQDPGWELFGGFVKQKPASIITENDSACSQRPSTWSPRMFEINAWQPYFRWINVWLCGCINNGWLLLFASQEMSCNRDNPIKWSHTLPKYFAVVIHIYFFHEWNSEYF